MGEKVGVVVPAGILIKLHVPVSSVPGASADKVAVV